MLHYTAEPTMYPYSCILCVVTARISLILNLNLEKLLYLSMKEISVRNINNAGNCDGSKWKHAIGPSKHTDKNKGILTEYLLWTWVMIKTQYTGMICN